jgi:small basic protein
MKSLQAFLRRHPWIAPCFILVFFGVKAVVANKFPYLGFWLGVTLLVSALLIVWGAEADCRRRRANGQSRDGQRTV